MTSPISPANGMEVGEITFDRPCCVVVDPTTGLTEQMLQQLRQPPAGDTDLSNEYGFVLGTILEVPIGMYRVEAYSADDDVLGVRLRLVSRGQVE